MKESRASLYSLMTGAAGGALAWCGVEMILLGVGGFPDVRIFTLVLGAVAGLLLGAVVPLAEGLRQSQKGKLKGALIIGSLCGALAGALGMAAGQLILASLTNSQMLMSLGEGSRGASLARIPGWTILGAVVGAASGIRSRSGRRMAAGLLGGLAGGLLGGIAAEFLGARLPRFYGRAAGMILWGVAVAFLADRFEARRSRGRLTVLAGPLKGRSFPVNQKVMRVGHSARSDLTLPGDKTTTEQKESSSAESARLLMKGGTVVLEAAEGADVQINGQKQKNELTELRYDDVVKVDGVTMIYEARR